MRSLHDDCCEKMKGVDPRLCTVIFLAHQLYTERYPRYCFRVTSGVRSEEEQRRLFQAKKSRTMQSQHLIGRAVDLAILSADRRVAHWDFPYYSRLNQCVQSIAEQVGVAVVWGGSWTTFPDGVHWQLD